MTKKSSGNEEAIDDEADHGPPGSQQETLNAAFVHEPDEDKAGAGYEDEEARGDVDDSRPDSAGIAALVEVVDDGDKSIVGFGEIVLARVAVDESIGGVAGGFEGYLDLGVVDAEVTDGPMDALGAEHFDQAELVDHCIVTLGGAVAEHLMPSHAVVHIGLQLA